MLHRWCPKKCSSTLQVKTDQPFIFLTNLTFYFHDRCGLHVIVCSNLWGHQKWSQTLQNATKHFLEHPQIHLGPPWHLLQKLMFSCFGHDKNQKLEEENEQMIDSEAHVQQTWSSQLVLKWVWTVWEIKGTNFLKSFESVQNYWLALEGRLSTFGALKVDVGRRVLRTNLKIIFKRPAK